MKLTETTLLRNYMKIITENQILDDLDPDKIEAIQNIVSKHTGVVYYSQIAGLMDVNSVSNEKAEKIFDALVKETNVELINDLGNIPSSVGISEKDLDGEQRKVYEKFTSRKNINNDVVERILLSGFESGKITEPQWQTLTSNLLSLEWKNERAKPDSVAKALTHVGIEIDDGLSGPETSQKLKTIKNSPHIEKLNQYEKDSANVINFLVGKARDGMENEVRLKLSNAVEAVKSAIANKQEPLPGSNGEIWYTIPEDDSKFLKNNVAYFIPYFNKALRNIGLIMHYKA